MACNLKGSSDPTVDLEGPAGASVTLKTKTQRGSADIVHLRYDGDEVPPPFKFTLKSGLNLLVVLAEASEVGLPVELREDCGDGSDKLLTTFPYDPKNPARGYFIKS
jgi:hypothetical protein